MTIGDDVGRLLVLLCSAVSFTPMVFFCGITALARHIPAELCYIGQFLQSCASTAGVAPDLAAVVQLMTSSSQVRCIVEQLYTSGQMKEAQLAGGKKGDSIK
jgi:hypothetical protein